MADSAHYVYTVTLPGVKSIKCQYRRTGASTWSDFGSADRIMPGLLVKYTVVPATDFEVTTNNLFYVGYYGVTVTIPKDNVPDENAWIFIMPNYDVTIQVGASPSGGGSDVLPESSVYKSNVLFHCTGVLDANSFLREWFAHNNYLGYETLVASKPWGTVKQAAHDSLGIIAISSASSDQYYLVATSSASGGIVGFPSQIPFDIQYSTQSTPMAFASWQGTATYVTLSGKTITPTNSVYTLTARMAIGLDSRYSSNLLGYYDDEEPTVVNAIQYILSPNDSGEVDGPETYSDTSFTFDYKIKVAYEFKRIRVFAVGEVSGTPPVPREEVISDVTETYDGDTRTYTFTVSSIPDWATGARCVIETIYLPNDENASGTNTSDGPIGGNGTFDDTSDEVPIPAIPAGISAADSGFVTLFRPTITQLKDLGNYLWSNLDEFWENLQKIFTNPMDYIIGLNIFPVSPAVGTDKSIYIGNWLTNISMPPVNNQFYEFDCGIRTIDEYFGSFLDYGPNTSARIMLPFIGDRDLAINEIMGKTLHLWYRINLLSGECLAALTINNSVYYQWNGNCAIPIPVTGSDWSRLYSGVAKAAVSVGALAAGGLAAGLGASIGAQTLSGFRENMPDVWLPPAVSNNASQTSNNLPAVRTGPMGFNPDAFGPTYVQEDFGLSRPAQAAIAMTTAGVVGHNIMGSTPRVSHSGDMSGGISIMGNRTPYIVLEYPNVNLPENYKHHYGYPSNQYAVLGNLSGYTECKAVMFESTTATDDEVALIIRTLKSGVYL